MIFQTYKLKPLNLETSFYAKWNKISIFSKDHTCKFGSFNYIFEISFLIEEKIGLFREDMGTIREIFPSLFFFSYKIFGISNEIHSQKFQNFEIKGLLI